MYLLPIFFPRLGGVDRSNADQRGYLTAIEMAQLRQAAEEYAAGNCSDTRRTLQNAVFLLVLRIMVDDLFYLALDAFDLAVQAFHDVSDAPLDLCLIGLLHALFFHCPHAEQLRPSLDEFLHEPLFLGREVCFFRVHSLCVQCKNLCIDLVCFRFFCG